jgi:Ca2+-binding RTX toxin-like protein
MTFLRRKAAAALVTAGALGAFQALAIVGASSASAVGVCTFSLATHTVSVTMDAADTHDLSVDDPSGEIELDGVAGSCPLADITNTTGIAVTGNTGDEYFVIDNASGLAFPSTISWQVAMGSGSADLLEIDLADGSDGSLTLSDSAFTMNGAAGAIGGIEGIYAQGGDGDDTIDGSAATIDLELYGGDGDDTLTGGAARDVVSGEDGEDTLAGGAGDDGWHVDGGATTNVFGDSPLVEGGVDDDTLFGGAGKDDLYGDPGDDWLSGEDGNDWEEGEEGSDTLYEGTAANGADMLEGDSPNVVGDIDTVDYGDRTTATAVNEGVAGASGADTNGDGDASDTGEEGDTVQNIETFVTGSANDTINGDGGDETFAPGAGDDAMDGGGGSNTLDYSGSAAGVIVDVAAGTATGAGSDTFTSDFDAFVGSDFDDTFIDDSGAYTYSGGDGVDTIDESARTDAVTQRLDGSAGTSEDDFDAADIENYVGSAGVDTVLGNILRNSLWGNDGNDSLNGAAGNDTLYGGVGSDDLAGGTGVDMVSFADASSGVAVDLSLGAASSADGDDTVTDIEGAIGSAFDDNMLGGTGTNLFKAGKGDDFVRAGSGDDTVKGGAGNDTLVGGGGDDSLYGAKGNDDLFGGGGTDYGNGGKGSDTCKGVEIKKSC